MIGIQFLPTESIPNQNDAVANAPVNFQIVTRTRTIYSKAVCSQQFLTVWIKGVNEMSQRNDKRTTNWIKFCSFSHENLNIYVRARGLKPNRQVNRWPWICLLIVRQIIFVSTIGNVLRTVRRTCVLMFECERLNFNFFTFFHCL